MFHWLFVQRTFLKYTHISPTHYRDIRNILIFKCIFLIYTCRRFYVSHPKILLINIPYIYTYDLYFLNISKFLRTTCNIPSSIRHHREINSRKKWKMLDKNRSMVSTWKIFDAKINKLYKIKLLLLANKQ